MRYDLFLSDFDGTLVRADGTVSKENIRAIAKYRRAGGVFAVVTGRMLSSIRARLKELGLEEGLVVAYQGAVIADIATGRLLKNEGFTAEQAQRAIRYLESEDMHIQIYADDVLYCNRDDELLAIYEKICGVKGTVIEEPLSEFAARKGLCVTKALAMLPPEGREALRLRAEAALGKEYFVTASSEWLVEILPASQNKASAVSFLSEYYRIPREKTAAIGDQLNDLPLIEAAGGRFAVANAVEELKERATVVPSAEEDGVAYAIEKFAMGEAL